MKILERYLFWQFLLAFIFSLLLFIMLFNVVDAFNKLEDFLRNSVPLQIIFSYYLYSLPGYLTHIVPISTLMAVVFSLGSLNKNNELIAIQVGGVSAWKIISPYILISCLVSFGVLWSNECLVPKTAVMAKSIKEGLIEKGKKDLKDRSIQDVTLLSQNGMILYAREYEIESQTLYEPHLSEGSIHVATQTNIKAQKAQYENGSWVLYYGLRYDVNKRGEMVGEPSTFDTMRIDLPENPEMLVKKSTDLEFMNSKELSLHIQKLKNTAIRRAQSLSVDLNYRMAVPFSSLVLVMVGTPLILRQDRRGVLMSAYYGMGILLAFYLCFSICLALGKSAQMNIPPAVAAWLTHMLFGLGGIFLLSKD